MLKNLINSGSTFTKEIKSEVWSILSQKLFYGHTTLAYEIRVTFLLAKSVFIYFLPQVDNSTVENRRIVYLMLDDAFFCLWNIVELWQHLVSR